MTSIGDKVYLSYIKGIFWLAGDKLRGFDDAIYSVMQN
jgi:hypothetical protein